MNWEIDICGLRTVRDLVSSVVVAAWLISIGESIIICEKVSFIWERKLCIELNRKRSKR